MFRLEIVSDPIQFVSDWIRTFVRFMDWERMPGMFDGFLEEVRNGEFRRDVYLRWLACCFSL